MVCEDQVHEKTDKRGTWAYHSVDGWYLATFQEHYHTHLCHIKKTNSERFTNTAQFSHQKITKPTITHADKIMSAISDCTKAIKDIGRNDGADELQQLLKLTEEAVKKNKDISKPENPTPHTNAEKQGGCAHAFPWVHTAQTLENKNKRITRNMTKYIPLILRVPLTAVPRVERTERMAQHDLPLNNQILTKIKARRRRHAQARPTVSGSAPASNTQSQTGKMTTAASGTRPTKRSSKRMSLLIRTMPDKHNKTTQTENAAAVEERRKSKHPRHTTQKINNLEIELHQAMAVMDEQTGRLLNYKQLMRDPKYKKKLEHFLSK